MYPFRKLTARILTAFALLIGLYSLYIEYYSERMVISVSGKLIIAFLFVAAMTIAALAYYLSVSDISKKLYYIRNFLVIIFVYYVLMLFDLLFLDSNFGRTATTVLPLEEYLREICNFEPLNTIRRYLHGYQNGNVSLQIMSINLLGNFCAFMPMGFFLPVLFQKCRSLGSFLLIICLTVFGVELLQIITRLGIGDIDDFILNVLGALLVYALMQLPFIKKLWQRI